MNASEFPPDTYSLVHSCRSHTRRKETTSGPKPTVTLLQVRLIPFAQRIPTLAVWDVVFCEPCTHSASRTLHLNRNGLAGVMVLCECSFPRAVRFWPLIALHTSSPTRSEVFCLILEKIFFLAADSLCHMASRATGLTFSACAKPSSVALPLIRS